MDRKPVAVLSLTNDSGIEILDIKYGIDDVVIYRYVYGTTREPEEEAIISYGEDGEPFIVIDGTEYLLSDFCKV